MLQLDCGVFMSNILELTPHCFNVKLKKILNYFFMINIQKKFRARGKHTLNTLISTYNHVQMIRYHSTQQKKVFNIHVIILDHISHIRWN